MKRILFDLEGNGLLDTITKVHCIVAGDPDSDDEPREFGPDNIGEAIAYLATADELIAHNGLRYDFPVLERVAGYRPKAVLRDTLVIARTKYPNIKELDGAFNKTLLRKGEPTMGKHFGSHTIGAWGRRLGEQKLHEDIEDWSTFTPEMLERCVSDWKVNRKLWHYLSPDQYSQEALHLEHRVAVLCERITQAGWPFDVRAAGLLHAELVKKRDALEKTLVESFGGWWGPKKDKKKIDRKQFFYAVGLKDNWDRAELIAALKAIPEGFTFPKPFVPKKDNKAKGYAAGAPCTQLEWVEFKPTSRQHIERCLRKLGWEPTEFTDKGQAKLDDEHLESAAAEVPQAAPLIEFLMLDKRIGQLATGDQAWLNHVGEDGRIHGAYNPMGTVTSRASHFLPNIAQVPASTSPYGKECRSLFTVPEGWEIVGADMSGLEGRCLAHYLAKHDGGAYGEMLLSGDPHWAVVKAVGFLDCPRNKESELHDLIRDGCKRLFYAMLYGAGALKTGRIILDTCRAARKIGAGTHYDKFFNTETPTPRQLQLVGGAAKRAVIEGIPGFTQLMHSIIGRKYLPGLDGRRVPVRSDHAALNTLLQSAGAILCKRWICDAYDALIADGLRWDDDDPYGPNSDFVFLGWIHDELQVACRNGLGDRVGKVLTRAAQEAGNPYGFRIRLDSEYKIGKTWADTH